MVEVDALISPATRIRGGVHVLFFDPGGPRESLVAPYCSIPRDYLSDTPLLRAMGFVVSQHGRLGAIPSPLFAERFPLGVHGK